MKTAVIAATLLAVSMAVAGCSATQTSSSDASPPGVAPVESYVLAKNSRFTVVVPGASDTARSLADRYLGNADKAWWIEEANVPTTGMAWSRAVVIPRSAPHSSGIHADGYQVVPILAYHRLGRDASAMTMTPALFREQMRYLAEHDYRVVSLRDLLDFLDGERRLPPRSVVITFDDGHQSIYKEAFPVLREFGYPATIFIYSDYINHGGLTWRQMKEMRASGLFTLLPHSKSHANLVMRLDGETQRDYLRRIEGEVVKPAQVLSRRFSDDIFAFAYPYGDANPVVVDLLRRQGYRLGVTVQPGGNPVFAAPLMLHRGMVFGNRGMDHFIERLVTFQSLSELAD